MNWKYSKKLVQAHDYNAANWTRYVDGRKTIDVNEIRNETSLMQKCYDE